MKGAIDSDAIVCVPDGDDIASVPPEVASCRDDVAFLSNLDRTSSFRKAVYRAKADGKDE